MRRAAAGPLRPGAGRRAHRPGPDRRPAAEPVALPRAAAGELGLLRGEPGRGHDAAAAHGAPRRRARRAAAADEGRGPAAHRHVQGPRCGGGAVPRGRARGRRGGPAQQRQRRGRLGRLRGPGRAALPRRHAGRVPGDHLGRVRSGRSARLPGRRADRRRGAPHPGHRGGPARVPGRLDPQGALPAGGQEDDRARDRRAAGLAGARRDHLPDRRRRGPDRHRQGPARAGAAGLDRPGAAAPGGGAGGGLRPGRAGRRAAGPGDRTVARGPDRGVRPHRSRPARRLPGPGGDPGHGGNRRGRDRRAAARQPAPGRAGRGDLGLPGGRRVLRGRRAAPPRRLAGRERRGRGGQHGRRAEVPADGARATAAAPRRRPHPG